MQNPFTFVFQLLVVTFFFQLVLFLFPKLKDWFHVSYLASVCYLAGHYFWGILQAVEQIRAALNPLWNALVPMLLAVSQLFLSFVFPLAPLAAVAYSLFSLQLLESIIYPTICITAILTALNRIDSEASFTRLTELARNFLIFSLFLLFTLFGAVLSASGGMSFLLMNQIKPSVLAIIQNSIPLVGSLFTEGLSTVKGLTTLSALTLGTTAAITIGGAVGLPLLKLVLDAFLLRASGALLVILGTERVGAILDDYGKLLFILCAWFLFMMTVVLLLFFYCIVLIQLVLGAA